MQTLLNPEALGFKYNVNNRVWYLTIGTRMYTLYENMYDMWSLSCNSVNESLRRPDNMLLLTEADLNNEDFVKSINTHDAKYEMLNELLDYLRAYLRTYIRNKFIDEVLIGL